MTAPASMMAFLARRSESRPTTGRTTTAESVKQASTTPASETVPPIATT